MTPVKSVNYGVWYAYGLYPNSEGFYKYGGFPYSKVTKNSEYNVCHAAWGEYFTVETTGFLSNIQENYNP